WVSSLSSTGLIWLDTLLLGLYANRDIGVYNVATRLVTVAVFVLAPLNAAFGPYLAHLHHQGRLDEVRRSYGAVTGWVVRLSLPAGHTARVVQVRALSHALPVTRGMLKGLAAGAAALVAGLLIRVVLPGGTGGLVLGLLVVCAVYAGVVLALGLSREDRMVLRA